uniref:Uncharacterized protein n=1 Tax=Cucumis melo TaxID=3656 RepID=A0A9I9D1S2_CUCME
MDEEDGEASWRTHARLNGDELNVDGVKTDSDGRLNHAPCLDAFDGWRMGHDGERLGLEFNERTKDATGMKTELWRATLTGTQRRTKKWRPMAACVDEETVTSCNEEEEGRLRMRGCQLG